MAKWQKYLMEATKTIDGGYVTKDGTSWYVDREDLDTGKTICKSTDNVIFTKNGKKYTAVVGSQHGRDGDVFLLRNVKVVDKGNL